VTPTSVINIGAIENKRMLQALIRILSQKRMDGVKVVLDRPPYCNLE
jgi:hypothetical protein